MSKHKMINIYDLTRHYGLKQSNFPVLIVPFPHKLGNERVIKQRSAAELASKAGSAAQANELAVRAKKTSRRISEWRVSRF